MKILLHAFTTTPGARGVAVELKKKIDDAVSWTQVSTEGPLLGHSKDFVLTRELFEQAVDNLHRDPRFHRGADGYGDADVLPFDVGHQSELPPDRQPVGGVPAVSWGQDLEVRDGPDGEAQLWCKVRWLSPMREQVKAGEWRWASITIYPSARDTRTNEEIGAVISSIAITNQPAVTNQSQLIAASRDFQFHHGATMTTPTTLEYNFKNGTTESVNTFTISLDNPTNPTSDDYARALAAVRSRPGGAKLSYDQAHAQVWDVIKASRFAALTKGA